MLLLKHRLRFLQLRVMGLVVIADVVFEHHWHRDMERQGSRSQVLAALSRRAVVESEGRSKSTAAGKL